MEGELHLVDFGKPQTLWSHLISPLMVRLERVSDLHKGLLPELIQEAGFEWVQERDSFSTIFGTLTLLKARKPGWLGGSS